MKKTGSLTSGTGLSSDADAALVVTDRDAAATRGATTDGRARSGSVLLLVRIARENMAGETEGRCVMFVQPFLSLRLMRIRN